MISPTARQMALLRFIAGYQEAHGYSPSYDECCRALGYGNSKQSINRIVRALAERGAIKWQPYRARAIEVLHKPAIPRAPDGEPLYFVEAHQQ